MMKVLVVVCALFSLSLGFPDKLPPYPAKGWKPQGARLELPKQKYGTPREERKDADGVESTTLSNDYLPPTTPTQDETDMLKVQGLPSADASSQFQPDRKSNIQARPILARIQTPVFVGHPFLLSPMFAPQFAPSSAQLKEISFERVEEPSDENKPKDDVQQLPVQSENVQPHRAYGPPVSTNNIPPENNNNNAPEPSQEEDEEKKPQEPQEEEDDEDEDENDEILDDGDDEEGTVIAISNAQANANYVDEKQQGQVGQYYILLPDNSLQKVRFATQQTEEDRQINGFSAQLRYSPVEAIRDPVYGYDEQGKLVRLYK
ncbi:CLUMA_CG003148, isoform B [Clunio marinus]|uniref:CLUMA_CG003148, isoform B n=1 Tax=Clunio marinus TaxID=568069 RepID=A0A1J1HMW8_9DIPT|nr:CLUMA_CG003148, isoform B [Clunio marinus]